MKYSILIANTMLNVQREYTSLEQGNKQRIIKSNLYKEIRGLTNIVEKMLRDIIKTLWFVVIILFFIDVEVFIFYLLLKIALVIYHMY